jgi:hypothetical protein
MAPQEMFALLEVIVLKALKILQAAHLAPIILELAKYLPTTVFHAPVVSTAVAQTARNPLEIATPATTVLAEVILRRRKLPALDILPQVRPSKKLLVPWVLIVQ